MLWFVYITLGPAHLPRPRLLIGPTWGTSALLEANQSEGEEVDWNIQSARYSVGGTASWSDSEMVQ